MDEKTSDLRELFLEVTEESTVTDRQADDRGSLAREGDPEERVASVVTTMRERYEFDTDLDDAALARIVRGFYADESDTEMAETVGVSRRELVRRRLDLHLVRETDLEAPFDLDALRERLDAGQPITEIADVLDVSGSTIRRYRRVIETIHERRAVGDRFRDEFDEILRDADLDARTEDVTRDGLEEATEGMESNVSF